MAAVQPMPQYVTDQDCECLDKVMASCSATEECLARLEAAGVDVKKARDENRQQMELAAGLKREFRPDRA